MGFYEQTFARLDELVTALAGASVEEVVDIYDELKRLRRSICRNPGTRKSYLVPRVTRALNKARDAIAKHKEGALYDIQRVQKVDGDDFLQMCHTATVVLAIIAFYVLVLTTGRV